MSDEKKKVVIDYRDINVMYNIDYKTVQEIADFYGITWGDAKQTLRDFGITVRINEPKATEPEKPYVIEKTDKLGLQAKVKASTPTTAKTVTTAQQV